MTRMRGTSPDAEYTFKHALVQDAAYATLVRSRRRQLHGQMAVTIEGQFPEIAETQPEVLARRCSEADFTAKAVGYWHRAGQQAMARGAMTEAVSPLRKGLELLRGMPDDVGRQEQELDLQIVLGNALIATNGWSAPEPGDAYARARQLCEQLNRPALLRPVLLGQWGFHQVRAELEQAEDCAKQILQFGEIRNELMWKCFGSYVSGYPCFYLGKFADAGAHCKNALSFWDPTYRAFWGSPNDAHVEAMTHFSRTLLSIGYIEQARLWRDQAIAFPAEFSTGRLSITSSTMPKSLAISAVRNVSRSTASSIFLSG